MPYERALCPKFRKPVNLSAFPIRFLVRLRADELVVRNGRSVARL